MIYFSAFFTLCMLYYITYVYKATQSTPPLPSPNFPTVSVIIAARNEAQNIDKCLQSILQQDYPPDKYEIILINDSSEDNTIAIAQKLAVHHPQLSILSLAQNAGKKAAIAYGISQAKGDIILQTDADCIVKQTWIATMMSFFTAKTALVSGPVLLISEQKALFSQLQIWEFMGLNLLGGGAMNQGKPNMCNGANLAFRKSVFEEVNGFQGIDQVASGDDELLLQKIDALKKYQIHYAYHPKAIVQTPVQATFSDFWQQRVRWVSKARAYQNKSINITQLLFFFAILGIPTLAVFGIWNKNFLIHSLCLFTLKTGYDFLLMRKASYFFHEKFNLFTFLCLEIAYIPYVISIGLVGNFVNTYTWKGRKVK